VTSFHCLVRREPHYRRDAIETGLRRLGYMQVQAPAPGPGNVLVIWNRKPVTDDALATMYERAGGKVIVVENAYAQKVDKTMYAMSLSQHHRGGPVGEGDRFSALGFEVKPWRSTPGGHVLICAQRSIGSPSMASPPQWAERMAEKVKALGLKPRIRQHPGNFKPTTPLVADLMGAYACAVWSSGAGVAALIEGIPVVYSAPTWICKTGASAGLNNLGYGDASRAHALHAMAWGQWTVAEITSGEPFALLLKDAS